ncbi:superinfection immunity protein [Ferrimonas marina]|uniref:Superinfection immunity protein n=1 Tax=Ferrimonas marina TaxID=299255 RepID=A0A1M5YVF0_9GAMM|nr:superinfection immunity protein [Ferrimonas marina]SHI15975.1 Superinfection immunity protein [Ferrimonas marina]
MNQLSQVWAQADGGFFVLVILAMLLVWFLPAMLALIFNRKHFRLILLACIPAGFSFIAWGGVMVWAISGKVTDRLRKQNASAAQVNR